MIRSFTLLDLESILQLEKQSFPKSPYDPSTFIHFHRLYPETFLLYADAENTDWLSKKTEIHGYILFTGEGHIISIAVHPRCRRQGIGKQLLLEMMKRPRLKRCWAEVRKSNHGARSFYSDLGFQITGMIPNYYGDEDALIIERRKPASSEWS